MKGIEGFSAKVTRPFVKRLDLVKIFLDGKEFPKQYIWLSQDGIWIPYERWQEGEWIGRFLATDTFQEDDSIPSQCDFKGDKFLFISEDKLYVIDVQTEFPKVELILKDVKKAQFWNECTVVLSDKENLTFICPKSEIVFPKKVQDFSLGTRYVAVFTGDKIEFFKMNFD